MEFLTDPIAVDEVVAQICDKQQQDVNGTTWLLVDAALVEFHRISSLAANWGWPIHNVFARSRLASFGAQAPHLIELPRDLGEVRSKLAKLLRPHSASPAFSWLRSQHSADALCEALAHLGFVRIDGDMDVHCRFADTRVLPALWAALSDKQRAPLAERMVAWGYSDRAGNAMDLIIGPIEVKPALTPFAGTLELDAHQFGAVLDASEPDTIFSALSETTPELITGRRRSNLYRALTQALASATGLNVTQAPDRLQFVVLSVYCGEDFFRSPGLAATWHEVAQGASLKELMKAWPPEIWKALEPREVDAAVSDV
ncbi:DUF4123 domain-containing protein [Ralstonia sp. CHL-2022]|uniref:DUF4123 domain-containing protein n=1 Tax=Ralstonia mojiangensis TaxID=2953895 RepID=A0AAE3LD15_9RALS|nr:DUF4123 domain-containing protein [Ralstonia mojiangensis]MCT7318769.1 DUF4123 domain-containing protein [Ralstonia mojiangensis]